MTGTETSAPSPSAAAQTPQRVSTAALLGDRAELEIEHKGEVYRLRVTRTGKLILTK